ncbi:MAG: glycosyltransferase family 2 protein [Acidobacteriota bacterium]
MLEKITPLILTYNEAANIGRTLDRLRWARDIVVVDSFSEDETLEIVSRYPQVRMFQRSFDNHRDQWSFGLSQTDITTEWVLALDADYVLTPEFEAELKALRRNSEVHGYQASFTYCINGNALRSGIYPPVTVLYRRASASYEQDGHTQKITAAGDVEQLHSRILHDDRKPLTEWLRSQVRYTELEANKLLQSTAASLSMPDRIRRWRLIAPFGMLFYCLILRRGILDGWAGFYYAFQRTLAETMLSLFLLEHDLRKSLGFRRARFELNVAEPLEHQRALRKSRGQ